MDRAFASKDGGFSDGLWETIQNHPDSQLPAAWCVLPNHYHVLVKTADLKTLVAALSRLHGGMSFRWNREELSGKKGLARGLGSGDAKRQYFQGYRELHPSQSRKTWICRSMV
jgi:hypothetical protein